MGKSDDCYNDKRRIFSFVLVNFDTNDWTSSKLSSQHEKERSQCWPSIFRWAIPPILSQAIRCRRFRAGRRLRRAFFLARQVLGDY
jgi:hypothetical protein